MRTGILSLAFVLSLAACGGAPAQSTTPSASGALPAGDKKPGEAQIGDKTVCPVTGEEFTVTASSPKVDYKGKTVYFCCAGCNDKFNANPEQFMKKFEGT